MLSRRVLRVRVLQYLYSYYSLIKFRDKPEQLKPDFLRNLSTSLQEINKYYYKVLSLPIIFSDINAEKKEIAKSEKIKKSPSRFNFSDNVVIDFLRRNKKLIDNLNRFKINWNAKTPEIRNWYNFVLDNEITKNYSLLNKPKFKDDFDYLIKEGAKVYATDINHKNLDSIVSKNVQIIETDDIFDVHYDIFSPCALGGVISMDNLKKLNCKIIAGAANNQLEDDINVPNELLKKDILYLPDFLINAGGIISVYHEQINQIDLQKVMQMTETIYDKAIDVFKYADENKITTHSAAMKIAVERIERNKKLIDTLNRFKIDWNAKTPEIRNWYNFVMDNEITKDYSSLNNPKFKDDFDYLKKLINKILFKNEDINQFFEIDNIHWYDDRIIIRSMIKKTIESLNSSNFNTFAFANLSEDIKDDINFASSLFESIIDHTSEYDEYITKHSKNWKIDRISLMDKSILRMGIGEMVNFSNIPIKVTMNECIDIAKNYSTPKSGLFINGVLDVISLNLQKKGMINKSGKGLIDNK